MPPIPAKGLSIKAMTKLSQANDNDAPEDWTLLKPNTPYGHLPVLYEITATGETLELAELSVIEFYLGKKFGLVGSNDWEEQLIRCHTISGGKLISREKIPMIMAMCEHVQQGSQYANWKASDQWKALAEETITRFNISPAYISELVLQ